MGKLLRFPVERCREPDSCARCAKPLPMLVYKTEIGQYCLGCANELSGNQPVITQAPFSEPWDDDPGAA